MVRLAWCTLLLVAMPTYAQAAVGYRDAMEKVLGCVHAAMTDAQLPVGVIPEQIAKAALARCFDEIEAATAAAVANSDMSAAKADSARVMLRKELYAYALQLSAAPYRHASYVGEVLVDAFAEGVFMAPRRSD